MKLLLFVPFILMLPFAPKDKTIVWDNHTLTCVSAPVAGYCGYARMLQLPDCSQRGQHAPKP